MNNPSHRVCMYRRIDKQTGELRDDFIHGVQFLDQQIPGVQFPQHS